MIEDKLQARDSTVPAQGQRLTEQAQPDCSIKIIITQCGQVGEFIRRSAGKRLAEKLQDNPQLTLAMADIAVRCA